MVSIVLNVTKHSHNIHHFKSMLECMTRLNRMPVILKAVVKLSAKFPILYDIKEFTLVKNHSSVRNARKSSRLVAIWNSIYRSITKGRSDLIISAFLRSKSSSYGNQHNSVFISNILYFSCDKSYLYQSSLKKHYMVCHKELYDKLVNE